MPTYEYECCSCHAKHEFLQKMSDEPITECPSCHQKTLQRKLSTGLGLSFQGSGFYITDYVKKDGQDNTGGSGGCGSGCGCKA